MSSDDTAQLIYLVLLGTVIGGYFVVANRKEMGAMARAAILWGLIFLGVAAGYGLWNGASDDLLLRQSLSEDGRVIEAPRNRDGHYYLTLHVGEEPIRFIVDTGATDVVLSIEDAQRVGIDTEDLAYTGLASTANGEVRTARVRLNDVRLGEFYEGAVSAWVNEGELRDSLLGMEYLQRFDKISIENNTLILER